MKGNSLTPIQLRVLKALYYFRFATLPDLSTYLAISTSYLHTTIQKLLTNQLIIQEIPDNQRLLHLPFIYSLAPAGIAFLRGTGKYDLRILNAHYKNNQVTSGMKKLRLALLRDVNALSLMYPTREIITEVQLRRIPQFPANRFHVYVQPLSDEPPIFFSNLSYLATRQKYLFAHQLLNALTATDWQELSVELLFHTGSAQDKGGLYRTLQAKQNALGLKASIKTDVSF